MAAGGFKIFTTGEVLTSADTNNFLMQGVLVFANAAARDAAITAPEEGQACYLKDTDAVLTYSGSTWVGFDDSNAIQNAIINAKGDLIAGSANDTPSILAAGSNGESIVADSSTTTGLRYQVPIQANPVINSAFQVFQRGISFTIASTTVTYTADRWACNRNATGMTVTQQNTNDTTNLPFILKCLRVARDSGNASTTQLQTAQSIETVNSITFAGRTVTFSFYARAGADYSATSNALTVQLIGGTGTDQGPYSYTGTTTPVNTTATLTTTWKRFSFTGSVGATVTELATRFFFDPAGTAGAADFFEVTGVQVEIGSVATLFKTNGATIQGELAACQRYYQRTNVTGAGVAAYQSVAFANTTTTAFLLLNNTVPLRIPATSVDFSLLCLADPGVGDFAITGLTLEAARCTGVVTSLKATVASNLTATRVYYSATTSVAGYIGLSAEL